MRAVLFDLDGTLHDRAAGLRRFVTDRAGRLGLAPEAMERFIRRFVELDAGGKVWKDRVYSGLRVEFDASSWPSTESLVDDYVQGFPEFAGEVAGASSLLMQLRKRGVKVAIVTNGRSDLQRAVIESLGFDSIVDAILISGDLGLRKPQREIFDRALGSVGAAPMEAIMVGDDLEADVRGALNVGMTPIAFRCDAGADVVTVHSMEELQNELIHRDLCDG